MTAEVAIYNSDAIAVAADSAITVGGKRVWDYGNKIFSLGPSHCLGIMYFNNSDIAGIPLETIIKIFKKDNSKQRFSTVSELKDRFVSHLQNIISKSIQDDDEALVALLIGFFSAKIVDLVEVSGPGMNPDVKISAASVKAVADTIKSEIDVEQSLLNKVDELKHYATQLIIELLEDQHPEIEIDSNIDFGDFFKASLRGNVVSEYFTGIVFFGFGDDEILPHLCMITVDGATSMHVRVIPNSLSSPTQLGVNSAGMVAFAQSDMTNLFMSGILQKNLESVEFLAAQYLPEKDARQLLKEFEQSRYEFVTHPIISAIETLPKEELAVVAKSMVELTALRRKIDSDIRSVGGPVDVAVVSKGDGFVWINRKHYFDPAINHDFFVRKGKGNR